MRITARLAMGLVLFFTVQVSAAEDKEFPLRKDVPCVSCWELVREEAPPSNPPNLFLLRHYRAPEAEKKFGPYGVAVWSQEVPELGVLYQAWNIAKLPNGAYDFSQATFAHQQEGDQWFVAPPGFFVYAGVGYNDVALVTVYRRRIPFGAKAEGLDQFVGEYRVRISTRTVTKIIFKMRDPQNPRREQWFELDLERTKVGKKIIQKEEIVK